ncbi:MAG: macro domain-containing protein [Selenomonadaceae bacterium]|nr:macro domain-containing protein [Selenomonadaceae bacterium]
MTPKILQADITTLKVDAIVNAANTQLLAGGGVCGAIFRAAGHSELQAACDKLAPIQTGEAVITPGFNLPAKFIIHTAGPIYMDGKHGEEKLLYACYTNSLKRAVENNLQSVAFPLISSGIYGYPVNEAMRVAFTAIRDFLSTHDDMEVTLTVINRSFIGEFISVARQLGYVTEVPNWT